MIQVNTPHIVQIRSHFTTSNVKVYHRFYSILIIKMQSCASEPLIPEPQYRHKKFDIHKKSSPEPSPIVVSTSGDMESEMKESQQSERKERPCESKDSNQISFETYLKVKEKLEQELNFCDELPMPALKKFRKSSSSSQNISEAVTIPPAIPEEALKEICQHKEKMKRKFPIKERSAKEQERRNKNTEACRVTRKMTQLKQIVIEEEYKRDYEENIKINEEFTRTSMYWHALLRLMNGDREILETISKE
uniref:BZIP domain-containing protein n=1 Tax=Glossina austeni TaxID=7395 RepID=A0A1A9VL76_GLOAU